MIDFRIDKYEVEDSEGTVSGFDDLDNARNYAKDLVETGTYDYAIVRSVIVCYELAMPERDDQIEFYKIRKIED